VIGTSRGIGLGLVSYILSSNAECRVIATCRNPSSASKLTDLVNEYGKKRLIVLQLDTTSQDSYASLLSKLVEESIDKIDVVIANAGIVNRKTVLTSTVDDMMGVYTTNVVGTMLTMQAFNRFLVAAGPNSSKLMVIISSELGSIEKMAGKGSTSSPYRCSKCAVNMLAVSYAQEESFQGAGGKVLTVHPGEQTQTIIRFLVIN
jgi:NAD(P)-dependent dehydrogenase (short-subunit alcohol dehydrogenase family)